MPSTDGSHSLFWAETGGADSLVNKIIARTSADAVMSEATAGEAGHLGTLVHQVKGEVITADDEAYDDARTVWNAAQKATPIAIVKCTGAADVALCVDHCRSLDLPLSIKCGGHLTTGEAVRDNAVVLDLSPMDAVRVDPATKTVRVGGGATWGDVYHETTRVGLLAPGGWDAAVGVGGFTLGGGQGLTVRTEGMACDCLIEADVVTADGEIVTASEREHADLFWALRGGGGNVGVVTSFVFECFELSQEFRTVALYFSLDDAKELFRRCREIFPTIPDALIPTVAVSSLPDHPEVPEGMRGEPGAFVYLVYVGDPTESQSAIDPYLEIAEPVLTIDAVVPFLEAFGDSPSGIRRHWSSLYLDELSDDLIDALVDELPPFPVTTRLVIFGFGELLDRYGPTETAYAHRESPYQLMVSVNWEDPEDDEKNHAWARRAFDRLVPHSNGGEYVNLQTDTDDRQQACFGGNLERLREVKATWDPENLFRPAQNVEPIHNG